MSKVIPEQFKELGECHFPHVVRVFAVELGDGGIRR